MVFYISVHHTEILPTSSLTAKCKTSAFRSNNLGKTKVVLILLGSTLFNPDRFSLVSLEVPQRNTYSTVLGLIASRICRITVFGNGERT